MFLGEIKVKKYLVISVVMAVVLIVFILLINMGDMNLFESIPTTEEQTTTEDANLLENKNRAEKKELMNSIDIENNGIARELPLPLKRIEHDEYFKLLAQLLGDFELNKLEIVGVTARKTGYSDRSPEYMLAVIYLIIIDSF